jgi:hypothetical protein
MKWYVSSLCAATRHVMGVMREALKRCRAMWGTLPTPLDRHSVEAFYGDLKQSRVCILHVHCVIFDRETVAYLLEWSCLMLMLSIS